MCSQNIAAVLSLSPSLFPLLIAVLCLRYFLTKEQIAIAKINQKNPVHKIFQIDRSQLLDTVPIIKSN